MASPVIASFSTVSDPSNTTSRTIAKPSGTASGDWLIIIAGADGNGGIATPSGFTEIFAAHAVTPTVESGIYVRKADGTEGSTFTINTSASEEVSACCLRITGGDSTDIVEALSSFLGEMGKAPNIRCPLAYASTDDTLVLRIGVSDGGSGSSVTIPGGTTGVCNLASDTSSAVLAVAYETKATAGYVDSASMANSGTTEEVLGFTLVLRSNSSESYPDQPVIKCMSAVMPTLSNAVDFQKPYGTEEDDLLLAHRVADNNGAFETMTDFTDIASAHSSAAVFQYMSYKIAGASEGDTYPAFGAVGYAQHGALLRIVNADTTTPVNTYSVANTGNNAAPTGSTITPSVDNCLLLWLCGADDDDQTWDTGYPSGYTGVYSTANQESADSTMMLAFDTQTTKTATGSVAGTLDASEQWIVFNVAIAPNVSGGTIEAAGSVTCTAIVTGVGTAVKSAVAGSSGSSVASGVGSSSNEISTVGAASGVGTTSGVGASVGSAVGSSSGSGSVSGSGAAIGAAIGSSAGTSSGVGYTSPLPVLWVKPYDSDERTLSGSDISGLNDLSPEGNDLGQILSAPIPNLQTSAKNSRDVANFDSSVHERLGIANNSSLTNIWSNGGGHIITMLRLDSAGQANVGRIANNFGPDVESLAGWTFETPDASGGYVRLQFKVKFSGSYAYWRTTDRVFPLGEYHIVQLTYDDSSTSNDPVLKLDGQVVDITEMVAPSGSIADDSGQAYFAIGGHGLGLDGAIGEMKVFNVPLSAAEEEAEAQAFSIGWDIPLITEVSAVGSSSGSSAAAGVGGADIPSVGSASGTSTTSGDTAVSGNAVGDSSGVTTVSGVGQADIPVVGSITATSSASAVGNSIAEVVGAVAGLATSAAVGGADIPVIGASNGTASISGVGSTETGSTATATGTSGASGIAISDAASDAVSSGIAIGDATGASDATTVGSASGSATGYGFSSGVITSVGTSSGAASISGIGAADIPAAGTTSGSGTALAVGQVVVPTVGSSEGSSTVSGITSASNGAVGLSTGAASVAGVGQADFLSVGASTGEGSASAVGSSVTAASGEATGVTNISGVGGSISSAAGSSSGSSILDGVGGTLSDATATGSATGNSSAGGIGAADFNAEGTSIGDSTPTGIGAADFMAIGEAQGLTSVVAVGSPLANVIGSIIGTAVVLGSSAVIFSTSGSITGVSTVEGTGLAYIPPSEDWFVHFDFSAIKRSVITFKAEYNSGDLGADSFQMDAYWTPTKILRAGT